MSQKATWVKNNKNEAPQQEEQVILPDEDVFDLNDFSTEDIKKTINPENIRDNQDSKFFYQPKEKNKEKSSHNWFLVTFLMTLIILGVLYFYFLIEDKNNKISGLEKQMSSKVEPKVKGVREVVGANPTPTTTTSDAINAKNFSLSTTGNNFNLKTSEVSVSINYFNNQIGTKTTFTKEIGKDSKNDNVEILWAEKQDSISKDQLVKNVSKQNPEFEIDSKVFKSASNQDFTLLKPKDSSNVTKIYVGVSDTFMYVVTTTNESFNQNPDTNINSFIDNIISKISFN
jgi:hypothetical protein